MGTDDARTQAPQVSRNENDYRDDPAPSQRLTQRHEKGIVDGIDYCSDTGSSDTRAA